MRRLGVTAARRVRAIWHTKVLRVPPAQRARSSLTIPSALTTPWAAGRTSTARDSPADPHTMMAACEADHTRAPDGDGSEAAPLMLHDDDDDDEMDACEDEEVGVDGANGTAMDVSGQSGSES